MQGLLLRTCSQNGSGVEAPDYRLAHASYSRRRRSIRASAGSKTALLTGATGGLGRAIAARARRRGAEPRALLAQGRGARAPGGRACPASIAWPSADLAEPGAALALVGRRGRHRRPRRERRAAGVGQARRASTRREVERALRVNLESPMLMAHALLPANDRARAGPHRDGRFALGRRADRAPVRSTTRPSSACAASRLALREDLRGTRSRRLARRARLRPRRGHVRRLGRRTLRPGWAPTRPQKVGAAVVEAIEKNRGEITVAPFHQVRLAKFAGRHPELAGRLSEQGRGQGGRRGRPRPGRQAVATAIHALVLSAYEVEVL